MIAEAKAVSKLNLYLKVTARRPDRYHDLETLFLPLGYPADRITIDFDAAPGIRLSSSLAGLPEDLGNLAGRAALAYADAARISPPWSIHIEKQIPVAAGMGGGSADAGTVLSLLSAHYGRVAHDDLAALALTLGADVPYFLSPRAATATGVGDRIAPIDGILTVPLLLVVNPHFPVSAKWAYTNLDRSRIGEDSEQRLPRLIAALRAGDAESVAQLLHNDLAFALYEKFPLLRQLREFMNANGALNSQITGSGPTMFAICRTQEERTRLAARLRETFSSETITVFEEIPTGILEISR